ncbi:MAG: HAMP domain-containing histidine kinase [Deltaproteobacteria bacterium]|nr:HAMP domain-containing histidine kinase [Deltaproteobacteria bacterium]
MVARAPAQHAGSAASTRRHDPDRIAHLAKRLPARVATLCGVLAGLLWIAEFAANAMLLDLTAEQIATQAQLTLYACTALAAVLVVSSLIYLRTLTIIRDQASRLQARAAALRFPAALVLVSLGTTTLLSAARFAVDHYLEHTSLALATALSIRFFTSTALFLPLLYVAIRRTLLPLHQLASDTIPTTGVRLPLRARLTLTITLLACGSIVPAAIAVSAQRNELHARSAARYRQQLADVFAVGGRQIDQRHLQWLARNVPLTGQRITLTDRLTESAAPLNLAGKPRFAQVLSQGDPRRSRRSLLIVCLALVLLALYVAFELSSSFRNDLRRLRQQVELAGAQPGNRPAQQSFARFTISALQFHDVRRLADAINRRLSRAAAAHVDHFITAERQIESERERTRFLTNVSHDLRGPLNSILGFTELLLQELDGPLTPLQRSDLDVVHRNATRLLRLINQVLDLATLQAGQLRLYREEQLPAALTSQVSQLLKHWNIGDVDLSIELQPGLSPIEVDAKRLTEAIALVIEASLLRAPGERIGLSVKEQPARDPRHDPLILIGISDSGRPLPAEQRERALNGLDRREGKKSGLGLELPLARELIRAHDGELELDLDQHGGNLCRITLPARRRRVGKLRAVRI